MEKSKTMEERLAATRQLTKDGLESLWRYCLSVALLNVLQAGQPATVETLIAALKDLPLGTDPLIGPASVAAAIEQLEVVGRGHHDSE